MKIEEKRALRAAQLSRAACVGKPHARSFVIEDGHFILTVRKVNGEISDLARELFGVPATAEVTLGEESCAYRWESYADTIFKAGGVMNQAFGDAYEERTAQLYGARLVQRAIETTGQVAIEAPTGTGKSLLSLAVAIKMGLTVVVSTSNKALQQQLYKKDVPLLLKHLSPMGRVVLVQGKKNYLCLRDGFTVSPTGERAALGIDSGDPMIDAQYEEWANATATGNLTDAPFDVPDGAVGGVTVPSTCPGKDCDHFDDCFYYEMKRQRSSAQVIICNHSLLALNQLYPLAGILPEFSLLVVDEAHNLEMFVRNAMTREFSIHKLRENVAQIFDTWGEGPAMSIGVDTYAIDEGDAPARDDVLAGIDKVIGWLKRIASRRNQRDIEILDRALVTDLPGTLTQAANVLYGAEGTGDTDADSARRNDATTLYNAAKNISSLCQTDDNVVRWITQPQGEDGRYRFGEGVKCVTAPLNVSGVIRSIAGVASFIEEEEPEDHTVCHKCGKGLSGDVYVLNGHAYDAGCILDVDVIGDAVVMSLEEWLDRPADETPVAHNAHATVFTSATLTNGGKFNSIFRGWGIEPKTTFIAESPFPFQKNCAVYIPAATTPAKRDFDDLVSFLADEMWALVRASKGGAFLLFTANARLHAVKDKLRQRMESIGLEVLVQGEHGKMYITERFREDPRCVLFATRTFFEGVSIDGPNLRVVAMDSLPFKPPSPLGTAQNMATRKEMVDRYNMTEDAAKWWTFKNMVCGAMVLDLKQAFGRLIRTETDRGVFAMLDTKARAAAYGRAAIGELPQMDIIRNIGEKAQLIEAPDVDKGGTDMENLLAFMAV